MISVTDIVEILFLGLSSMVLMLTILNAFSIWSLRLPPDRWASEVSLLIPMRNEERNVTSLTESIHRSFAVEEGRSNWEVIIIDDQSTDRTRTLLDESSPLLGSNSNIAELRVLTGEGPAPGWLGKPSASQRLFESAHGENLVFIDADVRLEPGAISAAIGQMDRAGWHFISPYPRQIAVSFMERMIQPLLQWSWFASVPLRLAARLRIPSMAVANGQFFVVKRAALEAIGGFSSVKGEILEDLELARTLWRHGFTGSVVDGSSIAHCRMYHNSDELVAGYGKSLWRAFGSPLGAFVALLLMIATSWLPLIAALLGNPLGWLAYFAISLSRLIAALRTSSFWQGFLLHPLSVAILIYLVITSFRLKRRGQLSWRDRSIAL